MSAASVHTEYKRPWGRLATPDLTRLWLCHTWEYPFDTEKLSDTELCCFVLTEKHSDPSVTATDYCLLTFCSTQSLILAEQRGGGRMPWTTQTDKNLVKKISLLFQELLLKNTKKKDNKSLAKQTERRWRICFSLGLHGLPVGLQLMQNGGVRMNVKEQQVRDIEGWEWV